MQNTFSFEQLDNLNIADQKAYLTTFFIPLSNGSHCFLNNGVYEMITDEVINKVYLKRVGKKLKEYYTEEYRTIRNPVYEINKPIFYENKINLCPQLPSHTPYKDFPKNIKDKCQIFLKYIMEVLCNNREDVQTHLHKWISNMCKGNKNDCALVLKTLAKGVGKSTLPQMLAKHILGPKLCLETGSEPIKSRFNNILGGKLLVSFEELETFSTAEWAAVDSVLKRQITSDSIVLQAKGQDAFTTKNINNYILLSNFDVYDSDRRMFVLDVQTQYKGNREYWSNLYNNCFNNDVGNALYSYFYEVDTNNYHPQDYPITENKINSISKRLDFAYQFIKEEYILNNKDIKSKLSDFYDDFKFWCSKEQKKACQKTDFISKLKEIQILHYKSHGYLCYNVKLDVLKDIADKQHWITECDEYTESNDDDDEDQNTTIQTPIQTSTIKAMTVDQYNKYDEEKEQHDKLKTEHKKVYNKLIQASSTTDKLIKMVMKDFNIENITMELEDHKSKLSETKIKNDKKTKKNNKYIEEFVQNIELF